MNQHEAEVLTNSEVLSILAEKRGNSKPNENNLVSLQNREYVEIKVQKLEVFTSSMRLPYLSFRGYINTK